MAKFKKGQSGNPGGKPKVPDALMQYKELTIDAVRRMIGKYTSQTMDELIASMKDPTTQGLELAIASALIKAIEEGDITRIDFLLSRTIGKVKEEKDINVNYSALPTHELIELSKEAIKVLSEEPKQLEEKKP